MASRGDSLAKLQLFLNTVVQPCNVTEFTLRSDNGGEYISSKFQNFCKNNSIAQQFTSPYSPHQNGIAERYWRMVFDNARALLLSSKLTEFFWVRAVDTVVYTRNRVITSAINDDQTPYEMFYGKQPSVHHLKVFGCLCISKIKTHQRKLLPKGKRQFLLVMTFQVVYFI